MKPEEQNKAIAKTVGECIPQWVWNGVGYRCAKCKRVDFASIWDERHPAPSNYLNDLNAMAKVEEWLLAYDKDLIHTYIKEIVRVVDLEGGYYTCATAAQRAESFLRAMSKWEE